MSGVKRAFVLMPFHQSYDSYYSAIFKPALEAVGYQVSRADDLFTPRPIMLDIQKSIVEADLILCEMSGKNPNVFYELGLSHAIGKPAILVSQTKEDIPFDLRHVRIILYDYSKTGWEDKLLEAIKAAARALEKIDMIWPPPLIATQDNLTAINENAGSKKADKAYHKLRKTRVGNLSNPIGKDSSNLEVGFDINKMSSYQIRLEILKINNTQFLYQILNDEKSGKNRIGVIEIINSRIRTLKKKYS